MVHPHKYDAARDKSAVGSLCGIKTADGSVLSLGLGAAHRAGIKEVILPKDKEKVLAEVPEEVKENLKFVLADHIEKVLKKPCWSPASQEDSFRLSHHFPATAFSAERRNDLRNRPWLIS
ncbi:MAG: S16 family serine protease [Dehalococcoidia bacterium]